MSGKFGSQNSDGFETAPGQSRGLARMMGLVCLLGIAILSAGCAPIVEVRGFVPDQDKTRALSKGVDNHSTVQEALGTPTVKSTFDEETWYYISERAERVAFLQPEILEREVLTLTFDPDTSKLKDIGRYSLKDGLVVTLISRTTPAKGRELSFLQEVFGSIGRVGALPNSRQQAPGRGGSRPN
jgi:outer membrane protein assembly factor BamE (lipoprotein component of BamABCDE complex)